MFPRVAFPVKTTFDEESYGLICRGVGCNEMAFDCMHRATMLDIRAKIRRDINGNQDVKKEDKDRRTYLWRKIHNRKCLIVGPREDYE